MLCEHLRPLEERILSRGFVESQRGRPRSTNCREWVTYNCDARLIANLEQISIPACVKNYERSYPQTGSESGLLCGEHDDALISGVLSGPFVPAFLGIESMASPDGLLEAAFLVWGDYDRGPIYRSPRIIRIGASEILVNLWDTPWSGAVSFEGGHTVTIMLSHYPQDITLHIDANSKMFNFEQTPNESEPLTSLIGRLEPLLPKPTPYIAPIRTSSARQRVWTMVMLAVSLVFVAAALWIIVARPPDAPIAAAWVGVFFFGACAVSAANDLRKRKPPA